MKNSRLKDLIAGYYDAVADIYHIKHGTGLYGCQWGIERHYLPLIKRFIPEDSFVLEIGCGTGRYTEILKKKVRHICGIDISPNMIEAAKKSNPDLDFFIGDCEELGNFKSEEFDVVFGANTFSYYPDKKRALASINRVLKRGGVFFDLDMNGACPLYYIEKIIKMNEMQSWYTYIRESTLRNLTQIFERAGFEIIYKTALNWVPNAIGKTTVSLLAPIDYIFSRTPAAKNFAMRVVVVGKKI